LYTSAEEIGPPTVIQYAVDANNPNATKKRFIRKRLLVKKKKKYAAIGFKID